MSVCGLVQVCSRAVCRLRPRLRSAPAPARLRSAPPSGLRSCGLRPRPPVCCLRPPPGLRSAPAPLRSAPRPARPHAPCGPRRARARARPHASRQHSRALPPLCGAICARPCLRPPCLRPRHALSARARAGLASLVKGRSMNAKITSSLLDDEQSIFAFFDSQYKFAWCNGARNGAMVLSKRKPVEKRHGSTFLETSRFR